MEPRPKIPTKLASGETEATGAAENSASQTGRIDGKWAGSEWTGTRDRLSAKPSCDTRQGGSAPKDPVGPELFAPRFHALCPLFPPTENRGIGHKRREKRRRIGPGGGQLTEFGSVENRGFGWDGGWCVSATETRLRRSYLRRHGARAVVTHVV